MLLRWRDDLYKDRHASAEDVLLVVEISQTSLKYDRIEKFALYAEAGIPEYWIVNLVDGIVEIYSQPGEGKYQLVRKVKRGETLQLPGGIESSIKVDDVLG